MKKVMSYAKEFFHRADIFLLVMGLICAIFGICCVCSIFNVIFGIVM